MLDGLPVATAQLTVAILPAAVGVRAIGPTRSVIGTRIAGAINGRARRVGVAIIPIAIIAVAGGIGGGRRVGVTAIIAIVIAIRPIGVVARSRRTYGRADCKTGYAGADRRCVAATARLGRDSRSKRQ